MLKVEDIIKQIIQELKQIYPSHKVYIGNLAEKANYPCFLINAGLNNARVTDTDKIQKKLSVDIVYFNSNKEKDDNNYIAKVRVADMLEEKWLNKLNVKVNNVNVKLDYNIADANDLLNIELMLTYFNNIVREEINYELIEEILLNTKVNKDNI